MAWVLKGPIAAPRASAQHSVGRAARGPSRFPMKSYERCPNAGYQAREVDGRGMNEDNKGDGYLEHLLSAPRSSVNMAETP